MTTFVRLVGFCQGMPDVRTFVTPIFVNDAGEYVAQSDPEGTGTVAAFEAIDVADGLERIEFDIAVKVGGPVLFAFEMSVSWLAVGTAKALANHLQHHLGRSPVFRETKPYTSAAIERFTAFATGIPGAAGESRLFEFMRSADAYVPMAMDTHEATSPGVEVPRNRTQWRDTILQCVGSDHAAYLDAHEETGRRIEQLVRSSKKRAETREHVGAGLWAVLRRTRIFKGRFLYLDTPVCHECLFRLAAEFPTPQTLDMVLKLAEPAAAEEAPSAKNLHGSAMEAVQHFLVQHNLPWETISEVRTRHMSLLASSSGDKQLAQRAELMMVELGARVDRAEAEAFLKDMRSENSHFADTTLFAANFAVRHPTWAGG